MTGQAYRKAGRVREGEGLRPAAWSGRVPSASAAQRHIGMASTSAGGQDARDGAKRRLNGRSRSVWVALLLAITGLAWYYKLPGLAYYWAATHAQGSEWREKGVWLPQYRVAIEGLPVQGLVDNASDLTFNAETGTLFAAINRPAQIAELSTDGRLLRLIPLAGAVDLEGITHVRGDLYIVADEKTSQLHWIRIGADTKTASIAQGSHLGLAIDAQEHFGLEGVSWDDSRGRLFVVKEKLPRRLLEIDGLDRFSGAGEFDLQIREWKSSHAFSLFLADLSGVTLVEHTGTLLVLSDDSALLVEYAPDGAPVSMMPLWPGFHGLSRFVPQAEGVAVAPDGTVYLLSEPNLFYRFERSRPRQAS